MSAAPGLESTKPADADLSVRSLLIPLEGMAILVPNALVSEVATLGDVAPDAHGPGWLIGSILWRGLRIPLVSFERITGASGGNPGRNSRAIVFNTLNGNRDLPFIAILSQRIPRLMLVTGRMLGRVDDAPAQEGILTRVEMHGDEVVVPDVDFLERMLVQQGIRAGRVIG
jgi:chemosensory pili system protein ChpC